MRLDVELSKQLSSMSFSSRWHYTVPLFPSMIRFHERHNLSKSGITNVRKVFHRAKRPCLYSDVPTIFNRLSVSFPAFSSSPSSRPSLLLHQHPPFPSSYSSPKPHPSCRQPASPPSLLPRSNPSNLPHPIRLFLASYLSSSLPSAISYSCPPRSLSFAFHLPALSQICSDVRTLQSRFQCLVQEQVLWSALSRDTRLVWPKVVACGLPL